MAPDAPHDAAEGPAPPFGQPDTTEDQRGEAQPADPDAAEEATDEAEALSHPPPDG